MLIASLIRHARAQFRAKLARHRPRLLTLLGLAAEARGEAQAEGGDAREMRLRSYTPPEAEHALLRNRIVTHDSYTANLKVRGAPA